MFGEITAFRHFDCGGAIYRHILPKRTTFKCATCLQWSKDLLDLVKDPTLKTAEADDDEQADITDLSAD